MGDNNNPPTLDPISETIGILKTEVAQAVKSRRALHTKFEDFSTQVLSELSAVTSKLDEHVRDEASMRALVSKHEKVVLEIQEKSLSEVETAFLRNILKKSQFWDQMTEIVSKGKIPALFVALISGALYATGFEKLSAIVARILH